jgi:hypothetical protein
MYYMSHHLARSVVLIVTIPLTTGRRRSFMSDSWARGTTWSLGIDGSISIVTAPAGRRSLHSGGLLSDRPVLISLGLVDGPETQLAPVVPSGGNWGQEAPSFGERGRLWLLGLWEFIRKYNRLIRSVAQSGSLPLTKLHLRSRFGSCHARSCRVAVSTVGAR